MRYSFICPTNFINNEYIGGQSDFNLALSHLIEIKGEPNDYTTQLVKAKVKHHKPIYLDNGVFENGKPEGIKTLVDKLYYLQGLGAKPEVVFIPDELYDKEATLNNITEWNKEYSLNTRDRCKVQSCVVVQGKSEQEFIEFLERIRTMGVDMIALSYLACVACFKEKTGTDDIATNRIEALKCAVRHGHTRIHLLGLGDSLEDLMFANDNYKYPSFRITNDSSSAFMLGINHKGYEKDGTIEGGKIKEKVNFEYPTISASQSDQIYKNINFIKAIKNDTES